MLAPKRDEGEYILFNRVRDPAHEVWDGPRAGQNGARKDFLADQSFPTKQFIKMLPELLAQRNSIYFLLGAQPRFDKMLLNAVKSLRDVIRAGIQSPINFMDVAPILHEMRLFKSPAELAVMQQAADITVAGHERVMQLCQANMYEYQLEAELLKSFCGEGARYPAYTSIVASGANSCILHYVRNNQKLKNNDLLLVDAGAEYQNYAADITRTFPINGRFTSEQRAIYDIVLAAQEAAIAAIKPGVSWNAPQEMIVKIITQGLVDLGILKGKVSDLIAKQAYAPFYMHRSGHWLGLDVHDVGQYKIHQKWRTFKPGMVLTVEPGIYMGQQANVHRRWQHIGVRIEDDVVVTAKASRVLSEKLPKKPDAIEALMMS